MEPHRQIGAAALSDPETGQLRQGRLAPGNTINDDQAVRVHLWMICHGGADHPFVIGYMTRAAGAGGSLPG